MEVLKPRAKIRVIAAGPFHNLIFWIILWGGAWVGLGGGLGYILGYEDVRGRGRVVMHVDQVRAEYVV